MLKNGILFCTNLWYDLIKIWGDKMEEKYSAMTVARTLIHLAHSKGISDITNLKLQKLLYFCEAYYMNATDKCKMFDENFNALTFGPVVLEVYNNYKSNLSYPIEIMEDDGFIIENSSETSRDYINTINQILESFGSMKASQLVALTHMTDSPWEKVWKKNREVSNYGTDGIIPKEETKNWFRKVFVDE